MAKVLGYRIRTLANVGAYATTAGIIIQVLIGPWVSTSIYDIPTIDFVYTAVLTKHRANTGPIAARGGPEAIYIIERLFDAAARKIGLDPVEIRRRNLIRPEQMPYTNAMAQVYDSGNFPSILEQGVALAAWDDFAMRAAESTARGLLRGRGLASFLEWTGANVFEERVTVAVKGDGEIEVYASTMPMGQGIATSYAQLVVDVFGVPLEKIRIVTGDTDRGSGVRQCRVAVAVHGGIGDRGGVADGGEGWPRSGRRGAGSGRGRPGICRGRVPGGGHRPAHRAVRPGGAAAGAADLRRLHQQGERAELAERLPCRARWRSIRRPGSSISFPTCRSTTWGAWSTR